MLVLAAIGWNTGKRRNPFVAIIKAIVLWWIANNRVCIHIQGNSWSAEWLSSRARYFAEYGAGAGTGT